MVKCNSVKFNQRSSTQKVAQRHLKVHLQRIRNKEYSRLRAMVPSIATKEKVSKVTVIEEAVKYIDELHKALYQRLQRKGLHNGSLSEGNLKEFIHSMIPANMFSRKEPTTCSYEKQQKIPSFLMQQKQKGPSKFC